MLNTVNYSNCTYHSTESKKEEESKKSKNIKLIINQRIENVKQGIINKTNKEKENYTETREGFIKKLQIPST